MNRLTYTLLCCLGGGLYGWIGDGGHVSSSVLSYPPSQRFWFPGLAWWVIPQFAVGGGVLSYIVASVVKAQQMRVLADNFPSYQRSLLGVALSLGTYLFSSVLFHFRVPQPIISLLLLGCTIGLFYYLRLPQRSPKAFLAIGSACFFGGIAWESSLCHFSFFRYEQPDLGLWVSHWIGLLWVGAVWSASLVMWRWEVTHAAEEEALHGKKIDAHAEVTYSGLKKSTTMYAAVAQYREKFRTEAIPKEYSVYDHFGLINAVGITLIGLTCWQAGGPTTMLSNRASQILMVIAFIQSNAFEYYAHRQKLHAPFVHTRHSHTHHRYFTDRVMEFDHFRDAHAILFPERAPYFLAVLISVFAFIPWLVCGWQPAMAYSCVLASYYLSYEWMHLAYHSPPDSFLGSLPFIPYLRAHHQIHHSQSLMGRWNFNITWPITDALLGTTYRGPLLQPGIPDVRAYEEREAAEHPEQREKDLARAREVQMKNGTIGTKVPGDDNLSAILGSWTKAAPKKDL